MNRVSNSISDETLSRIIQIESGGNPRAKASTSTALGLAQFLNGTWLQTVKRHRPDLMDGRTQAQVLAMRTNPSLSIELLARFTEDNAATLGGDPTDGDLYLAHFSGAGVARKLMRAKPEASAATCYSKEAIAANRSILEGKTVGQVRAWADRKMAAAGKTNWVAKHYRPAAAEPADDDVPVKIDREAPPKSLGESNIVKGAAAAATATAPPLAGAAIKVATDDAPDAGPTVVEKVTDVVDRGGSLISSTKSVVETVPVPRGFWHGLAAVLTDPIIVCVFGALALGAIAYVIYERRRKLREEGA